MELTIERESGIRLVKLAAGGRWASPDDLKAFARNSGLLADFAFSRLLALKPKESGSVAATDIVRLIGLRYDVDVEGELEFRRSDAQDDATLVHFEAVGGEVRVAAEVEGEQRRGVLRPVKGRVTFDRDRMLIAMADGEWHTDVDWATRDHLLFGTKGVRDVDVQSHYEAEVQDGPAKGARIENSR